jgi:hypothetical protein
MEEGDLNRAQTYLEEALAFARAAGSKSRIALYLAESGVLSYLQGKLKEFKQNLSESFSLKIDLSNSHKAILLMIILGSLYFQRPESSVRIIGAVHRYERECEFPDMPLKPLEKRYWDRADAHARKTLGDAIFEYAFADGQKMSLDEALDLALRTVEEI